MSTTPLFSHIYIEEGANEYPLTTKLRERFSRAQVIPIHNYKEIFNRPRQRWDHQRRALKLILAVRRDNFVYEGSHFVPSFGHTKFFYNTNVLNCLYGCEYCYLQGMFPSANVVTFVNTDDFEEHARLTAGDNEAYLCVSYDTDLLAFEELFGLCHTWIEFARKNPHITVELRTKSANFAAIKKITPPKNLILAWTVSPAEITDRFEHRTPSLDARIASIGAAIASGWKVRLCFDPLLLVDGWKDLYQRCVSHVFSLVDPSSLHDVSIGVFRINSKYLRSMQESSPGSALLQHPYHVENGAASYPIEERRELLAYVSEHVRRFVSPERVCPIDWQS